MIFKISFHRRLVLSAYAMVGLFAATAISQPLISGTILDSATSAPISKATVALKVSGKAVLTDSLGKFSIQSGSSVLSKPLCGNSGPLRIAFNGTTVSFITLSENQSVSIDIFDLNGRFRESVVKGIFNKGTHRVVFDENSRASGMVLVRWSMGLERGVVQWMPGMGIKSGNGFLSQEGLSRKASVTADTVVTDRYGYYSVIKATAIPSADVTIKLRKMPADSVVPPGMREIQEDSFIMGSQNGQASETPEHLVYLSAFFVDSVEVPQFEYELLMNTKPWENSTVSTPGGKGIFHPVWGVTWFDAVLFCNERSKRDGLDTVYQYKGMTGIFGNGSKLDTLTIDYSKRGYRLPTEAEWEYACGMGYGDPYPWGTNRDSSVAYAWSSENSQATTHPVAQKKPTYFSLYDITGNVDEWINDWYSGNYNPADSINPVGAANGPGKIIRGGDWYYDSKQLRVTIRGFFTQTSRYGFLGFRVVLPKR